MRVSDETLPGGKYRLSRLQVSIERLLGERAYTVKALEREPSILALEIDDARRWRDVGGRLRSALNRMEQLGVVERVRFSEHRHAYRLTDDGHVDLLARTHRGEDTP